MGGKCIVPRCQGYHTAYKGDGCNVKVFSIPSLDSPDYKKWISYLENVGRDLGELTTNSGVCEQHFEDNQIWSRIGSNGGRETIFKYIFSHINLMYPTVFAQCPLYT